MPKDNRVLQTEDAPFFSSFPPAVAGFARGATQAIVLAAVGAFITYTEAADLGEHAIWVPLILVLARTLEGFVDQKSAG